MKTYTHNLIRNTFYFALAMLFVFSPSPLVVNASTSVLGVTFDPNPLFSESSFLPGDATHGTVTVTNSSDSIQNVYVEAVNATDNNGLGNMLRLKIISGVDTFYDGMMHDFLVAGPVALGALSSGGNRGFVFEVAFTGDDNTLQEGTLGFDLCVGFSGGDYSCGDTVISPEIPRDGDKGGKVYGGGKGKTSGVKLLINDERVISMKPQNGTALIGWQTNLLATGQVIYGLASGTYTLDLNSAPYFGYPHGTVEVTTKSTQHAIDIANLEPGKVYKYRVISRASPPTISPEYTFIFPDDKVRELAFVGGENVGTSSGVYVGTGEGTSSEEIPIESKVSENDGINNNLAALGALPKGILGFLDSFECVTYVLLILFVIFIAWIAFDNWKGYKYKLSRKDRVSRRNIFLISGTFVALLASLIFGKFCLLIPLLVALLLLILWSLFNSKEDNGGNVNKGGGTMQNHQHIH